MPSTERLAWGVLGTGRAAAQFARSLQRSATGRLASVAGQSKESVERFSSLVPPVRTYGSYEGVLSDARVDIVYVALPHSLHREWTLRALRAGKPVLCEKPLGVNAHEAQEMVDTARSIGCFLMEAFAYRCHSRTKRLLDLLKDGVIGTVRQVDAQFNFWANPLDRRLFDATMGGGAILDVGCYVMSAARLIAAASAKTPEPTSISGDAVWRYGVEVEAYAQVAFGDSFSATLRASIAGPSSQALRVFGSAGTIEIENPFVFGTDVKTVLWSNSAAVNIMSTANDERDLYAIEADTVAEHLTRGESPCVPLTDSIANMVALDRWRRCLAC